MMWRFLAWFSMVGTISSALFLWFVFPHLMTHRKESNILIRGWKKHGGHDGYVLPLPGLP